MDQKYYNNDNGSYHAENNNPTEKPGYYTTQQTNQQDVFGVYNDRHSSQGPKMRYPQEPQKKPKSRIGLGILIGILIMVVVDLVALGAIGLTGAFRRINTGGAAVIDSAGDAADAGYQEKLQLIEQYLDAYYMGERDPQVLEDSLAKGMLNGIGDKYAKYYSEEEYNQLLEEISGNYAGIGVSVAKNDAGLVEVYKVFEGTPAEEAGIRVGDKIVEAAGITEFETIDDLVAVVRGEEGTTVDLVVLRENEQIKMTVERKRIEIPTIASKMLDNNIGYIQIAEFEVATVDQFSAAIDALENEGMTSLILDLRDNPGGDYSSVVAMADRVLPEGVIISTKDKNGNVQSENSDEANKLTVPCVVLVNGNSASAAELFTGALQDYEIATVVGTTTYGKGVVQSIFTMPDGSGMKFTTETYYTPKGRDINGVGIEPDVVVEIPEEALKDGVLDESEDTQMQKAIEILSGATE